MCKETTVSRPTAFSPYIPKRLSQQHPCNQQQQTILYIEDFWRKIEFLKQYKNSTERFIKHLENGFKDVNTNESNSVKKKLAISKTLYKLVMEDPATVNSYIPRIEDYVVLKRIYTTIYGAANKR